MIVAKGTIHLRLQQIWQIFEPSLPADCWRLKWMGPNINCLPISKIWLMTFYCFEALWTKILPPVSVLFSLALYMLWKLEVWYVLCYNKTVWLMTIAWSRTWAHVTGLISYQNEALNPKSVESANPPITITYETEQEERKTYTVSLLLSLDCSFIFEFYLMFTTISAAGKTTNACIFYQIDLHSVCKKM